MNHDPYCTWNPIARSVVLGLETNDGQFKAAQLSKFRLSLVATPVANGTVGRDSHWIIICKKDNVKDLEFFQSRMEPDKHATGTEQDERRWNQEPMDEFSAIPRRLETDN